MSLKNFQYNRILQKYDEIQLYNKHKLDERKKQIYKEIPEYKKLEQSIISLSMEQAKASLFDEAASFSSYAAKNQELLAKKKQLLVAHAYPSDYLDPIYTCKDCKDTGYIENEKCHCFKQSIVNILYEQGNVGTLLERENFSNFQIDYYDKKTPDPHLSITPYDNMMRVLSECKRFVLEFDTTYSNLLLYGNTGVGKTFLANCIAKELLDLAHTVVYLTAFELFEILEKNKFSKSNEEKTEMNDRFHYILHSDLLIIDDLGTELVNSFSASQVYLCINERHLSQKPTIISTNLSLDDISSLYSERVFSRIISNYHLLKILGEDIRLKKAFTT
ncbi:MAG: replication protein DnaC [Clostridiales bacterium]|nr:replication protein DnaC [Clostridiales bacterium]